MPKILLTGVATLDIINQLSHFPREDSEVRASAQLLRTGGNAANSAIVIQQLGITASLLCTFADDAASTQIKHQLIQRQVDVSLCPVQGNSATPTSYITLNLSNGSRTIVHHRQLDELTADYFLQLRLAEFDWLHFEGRNCQQLQPMLQYAQSFKLPISIELEKPREHLDEILQYADVLLISRPFAESRGFASASECLEFFSQRYSQAVITCSWGEQGAWAYDKTRIIHQPAFALDTTVETLGAGDTFNAAFIMALIKHKSVSDALGFACQLAAEKCQQTGFDNLSI